VFTTIQRISHFAAHQSGSPLLPLDVTCGMLLLASLFVVALYVRIRRQVRSVEMQVTGQGALRQAMETSNGAKTEFLTNVSHEIRTPMNGIIGFTDLALRIELKPQLREYLDTVRTSAEWLMHTIAEVLDFSRIEAGELKLEQAEFSFPECLRSAVQFLQPQATLKNLRIALKIDDRIPVRVCGDATRLRQIVVNLLDNAVKFTTAGSAMVSAALISESEEALTIRISVADTGVGISADQQKSIFEPFRLADTSRHKKSGGAGLGLAMSSRLISLMGGTIDVQSQIGAGATVRFTTQFRRAAPGRVKHEVSNPASSGQDSLSGDLVGPVSAAQSSGGTSPMLVNPNRPSVGSTTSMP
jgi:two-component system, sensor histidine kinase and response regulator